MTDAILHLGFSIFLRCFYIPATAYYCYFAGLYKYFSCIPYTTPFPICSPCCNQLGWKSRDRKEPLPLTRPTVVFALTFDSVFVLPTQKKQSPPQQYFAFRYFLDSPFLAVLYRFSVVLDFIESLRSRLCVSSVGRLDREKVDCKGETEVNKAQPVSHTRRTSDSTSSEFAAIFIFIFDVSFASLLRHHTVPGSARQTSQVS